MPTSVIPKFATRLRQVIAAVALKAVSQVIANLP